MTKDKTAISPPHFLGRKFRGLKDKKEAENPKIVTTTDELAETGYQGI